MENGKTDLYIRIMIFFYALLAIAISSMIVNNLFFLYLGQVERNGKAVLGEALNIIGIIFAFFDGLLCD